MRLSIVIPAYNEEKVIGGVLKQLREHYHDIIVVDDASTDRTAHIARAAGVRVVSHILNRGLGGSLGTGIQKALNDGADIIVTFDADGQHHVDDIGPLVAPIQMGRADAVIGSRMLQKKGMPFIRRVYNNIGNIITFVLFGIHVSDSQSGLRAFNRHAAGLMKLRSNRMEVSSEIVREIKVHKLRYEEVPIRAIYTDYSLSKGQGLFVGIKTLIKLIVLKIIR